MRILVGASVALSLVAGAFSSFNPVVGSPEITAWPGVNGAQVAAETSGTDDLNGIVTRNDEDSPAEEPSAQTYRMDLVPTIPTAAEGVDKHGIPLPGGTIEPEAVTFRRALTTDITVLGLTWKTSPSDVVVYYRFLVDGNWLPWNHLNHQSEDQISEREGARFLERGGTEVAAITNATMVEAKLMVSPGQTLPEEPEITIVSSQSPAGQENEGEDNPDFQNGPAIEAGHHLRDANHGEGTGHREAADYVEHSDLVNAPIRSTYFSAIPLVVKSAKQNPRPRLRRPEILSRQAWGADPKLLDWKVEYGHPKAIIVHHTATGGDHATKAQIPGLIRNIYYFHAKVRGWGDIGYNVIIDRFGRAWQGRNGNVQLNPVAAHAWGVNSVTFGISVLGSYESAEISPAAEQKLAEVVAWKADQMGLNPLGQVTFTEKAKGHKPPFTAPVVGGHRDVGSTSCPGNALYMQLQRVRNKAAQYMVTGPRLPFVDVDDDNLFLNEITWMKAQGLSTGWEDGTYRPWTPVQRDAVITFLHRMVKGTTVEVPTENTVEEFVDVPPGTAFYKEISWAKANGISTGWSDGTFRPTAATNRDAMAAFLYRMCHQYPQACSQTARNATVDGRPQFFKDVPPSHPFYEQIQWMGYSGLSTGWNTPQGREYRPWKATNRDAMAAFLKRMSVQ
ncbi:S-layer homology domain-containing protein [Boudabousia marimammalium]|uniref:SLH domain-containing protein n=1 Tax=Boudabousia marimammalium TaxID=156892 RepID=A0A1Q5PMC3_9ACTO|nr:S-layer homology domain-containing protein [Boudabousia marimammalium]OKL48708.1 hypothetical protein BM477_05800 [Boudabousia marimammalium]